MITGKLAKFSQVAELVASPERMFEYKLSTYQSVDTLRAETLGDSRKKGRADACLAALFQGLELLRELSMHPRVQSIWWDSELWDRWLADGFLWREKSASQPRTPATIARGQRIWQAFEVATELLRQPPASAATIEEPGVLQMTDTWNARLSEGQIFTLVECAQIYRDVRGDYQRALVILLGIEAAGVEPAERRANLLSEIGYTWMLAGRPPAARDCFERAIQESPSFAMVYADWGLLELGEGNFAEGERLLRRARELEPLGPAGIKASSALDKLRAR